MHNDGLGIASIRDLDALDVLLLIAGALVGGVAGAVGSALLAPSTPVNPKLVGVVAASCGVGAIRLRRAYRKPELDRVYVDPASVPMIGARSLLSGLLVGVGALVAIAGLIGLALVIALLTSPHGARLDGAAGYLLVPIGILGVAGGMIWLGLRRRA